MTVPVSLTTMSVVPDDPRGDDSAAAEFEAAVEEHAATWEGTVEPPEAVVTAVGRLDAVVDDWFDRHLRRHPAADRLMYTVTELADFSLLWHLVGTWRGVVSEQHEREAIRLSVVLGAESTVVNGVLKSLFRRERPVPELTRPHHLRIPLTTSFPSGHASAAFCAATLLAERSRFPLAWYALAAVVASSRVHVRIHHASDVLAGAGAGLVLGRVARRLWRV
jgi:undecaprenyl-diphosphatase